MPSDSTIMPILNQWPKSLLAEIRYNVTALLSVGYIIISLFKNVLYI